MKSLVKCDIYKLKKSRYFWICLIISVLLAAATVFLLDFTYKLAGENMEAQIEQQQAAMEESGLSVSAEGIPTNYDNLSTSAQLMTFFAGNTTLIMAVLISLFVGSEFNQGTIKNIASRNYSRSAIYLSKLIVGILVSILYTLLFVLTAALIASVLWGFGDVSSDFWIHTLQRGALELLLGAAYASLFVMFSILIRQNGGSLAVNICFLEFTSLILSLAEMAAGKLLGHSVSLSQYLPDMNMSILAQNPDRGDLLRALAVGICFLVLPAFIGIWSFNKRDIK